VPIAESAPHSTGRLNGAELKNFRLRHSFVVTARIGAAQPEGERDASRGGRGGPGVRPERRLGQFRIERREAVGPKVGAELQGKALLAILSASS